MLFTASHNVWQVTLMLYFCKNELSALLKNIPLWTQLQMYYQHDRILPHFTRNVMHYLKAIPWSKDWPWWSIELATMVTRYQSARFPCVELHEKCGVWDELLQQIFITARHVNDSAVHEVTLSITEWVRMCIQADSAILNIYYTEMYRHFSKLYCKVNCPLFIWHFWLKVASEKRSWCTDMKLSDTCIYIHLKVLFVNPLTDKVKV
jgi:hypothetical protein